MTAIKGLGGAVNAIIGEPRAVRGRIQSLHELCEAIALARQEARVRGL